MEIQKAGEVRKSLYDYLELSGFHVNDERHREIKKHIIAHTVAETARYIEEKRNATDALANVRVTPKVITIAKRTENFQCPACGLNMEKRADGSYVTKCGHASGIAFNYA